MREEDSRTVQTLARFFIYTAVLFGMLLGLTHFTKPGDIARLKENGLIEWVEFAFLISTAAVFAIGARIDRSIRELFMLLCFAASIAGIRELDGVFDKLPYIRWWMPAMIFAITGVVLCIRRRRFHALFTLWVVGWLYGLSSYITATRSSHKVNKKVDFQDRLDILLEMRLSGVAEQEYTGLYGKSRIMFV